MRDNSYLQPHIDAFKRTEETLRNLSAFTSSLNPKLEMPEGVYQTNFSGQIKDNTNPHALSRATSEGTYRNISINL